MDEEQILPTESESETIGGTSTVTTPTGDATRTIEVNPTTGEPIEGITEEEWDELILLLNDIKTNTVPITTQPISFDQGSKISQSLEVIESGVLVTIFVVLIVFVFKWIYRQVNSWF